MTRPAIWQEMKAMPPLPAGADAARGPEAGGPSVRASLIIPARNAADSIEKAALEAHRFLERAFPGSFELILVPNPRPGYTDDRTESVARALASRLPGIRVAPHLFPPGKGAALRTGFLASRGELVFFTDADLPYDLEFLERATRKLEEGHDLVTGNRRLPESEFDLPVHLMKLAYGRHRLGLLFNRAARLLFPIGTTDTQAGIKAMSRRLASAAFGRQACPGFFFDLEIFLTAMENSYRITELPVTLFLNSEKSTVRLLREAWLATFWLLRLAVRNHRRAYRIAGS